MIAKEIPVAENKPKQVKLLRGYFDYERLDTSGTMTTGGQKEKRNGDPKINPIIICHMEWQ